VFHKDQLILGPVEFVAYTEDVVDLFDRHTVNHHLYADDQYFYLHTEPGLASTGLTRLVNCFSELSGWCASRRLQLNAAKTELIWCGSRAMLHRLTSDNLSLSLSLSIGSVVVNSVDIVLDLGVLLDSELTMKQHINHVVSFYHLRRLRQLRRHITQEAMKQLVCSLILSRIDYCNSILISLPAASSAAPLQRLQNAAARLVMGLRARDHVTSALSSLHWLQIHYRIHYKVASLMMFFIHTHQCPGYLSRLISSSLSIITLHVNFSVHLPALTI